MSKFVITIGREFGCNASEVGRKLASKLNVKFYEKELVERAAKIAGIDESSAYDIDRKKSEKDLIKYYINEFDYGTTNAYYKSEAVAAQAYVIRDIANTETCVMFGRCSDHFLADYENVLNIFLYAPFSFRRQHVSSAYNLPFKNAEKLIKKVDFLRQKWYKFVTGQSREELTARHMMINMEKFSVDEAVEMILFAAKLKFESLK
ncbi:AAA family ATPase [Treponema zioleckii]|uniref:cytidylate kinase-like family protein n=1 Tax=Treponema zioleckii TaxID=331680 RepID=UPI00168AD14E|nr:cytidylate kinase-like family protein [Treponema zioleckii]